MGEVYRARDLKLGREVAVKDHHALGVDLLGVSETGVQPLEIGRLARRLLVPLPLDLGVTW